VKQNNRIINSLKWYHSRACFSCYCDTCDTCEKVVGLLLKSINTKGKPSDSKAKRHGLLIGGEKVVGLLLKSVGTKGKPSDNKAKRHGRITDKTESRRENPVIARINDTDTSRIKQNRPTLLTVLLIL
jgi:hypothetical protein